MRSWIVLAYYKNSRSSFLQLRENDEDNKSRVNEEIN